MATSISSLPSFSTFPCLDYFNHQDAVIPDFSSLCRIDAVDVISPDTDRNSQPRNEGVKRGEVLECARVIARRLPVDNDGSSGCPKGTYQSFLIKS